jgi:hypothetical protein
MDAWRQGIDACRHAMRDRSAEAKPAIIVFKQAGVGTCHGQAISSTKSVDKSVHKWFTETS